MNPVSVIFALEREASPFRRSMRGRDDVEVHLSGVGSRRARSAAELVVASQPRLVIASGFCGAIVDDLKTGDIVMSPRIVTVDRLVVDSEAKRKLGQHSEADAVDMESAAIEDVCREAGVPFLAVRAVSDTVDTALSPSLVRLLSGGRVSPVKAAAAVLRQPSLLAEFRRLARDTRLAAQRLAEALANVIQQQDSPAFSTSRSLS